MAQRISIPTALRKLTDNHATVEVQATTVREALDQLCARHPAVRERLFDEQGTLRRFVNVFLNDQDVRFLEGLQTALKENDELTLIPAIAGG